MCTVGLRSQTEGRLCQQRLTSDTRNTPLIRERHTVSAKPSRTRQGKLVRLTPLTVVERKLHLITIKRLMTIILRLCILITHLFTRLLL